MKINRAILGAVAAAAMVAAFASSALANQVTVNRIAGYYSGSGGEFNLVPVDGPLTGFAANYDAKAIVGNGFESFCLERFEPVTLGNTYYYQLNSDAVKGGTATSDPISVGTALLYGRFASGTLFGYDYLNLSVGRTVSAGQLQLAIWWLENELVLTAGQQAANPFIAMVKGLFADPTADNYINPLIQVINLGTTANGNDGLWPKQDMLYYGGGCVPDGGTTLILLGMAMTGLVAIQRKTRKA